MFITNSLIFKLIKLVLMLFCDSSVLFNFPGVTVYVINTIRVFVIVWFTCSVLEGQRLLARVAWKISIKEQTGQGKISGPWLHRTVVSYILDFLKKPQKLNNLDHLGEIKGDKEQLFFLWWTSLNIQKLPQKWALGAEKHCDADSKLDGSCDLQWTLPCFGASLIWHL